MSVENFAKFPEYLKKIEEVVDKEYEKLVQIGENVLDKIK